MGIWRRVELKDGTFLVYRRGNNRHTDHWHVAPDGTILSVKENGEHVYNRGKTRRAIREITGVDWYDGWVPADD